MIDTLDDALAYRRRRALAWERNIQYWLTGPLRHVTDVGSFIVERAATLCRTTTKLSDPLLIDMGFGDAWLLRALLETGTNHQYLGIDAVEAFVARANETYKACKCARFAVADLEENLQLNIAADVIVNAFNFFELSNLSLAMKNVAQNLRPGGTLLMSTIDKTYLILALSKDHDDFVGNLRRYQELPGTKYAFQQIDMDTHASEVLEYPSVLYSVEDYINAAKAHGLSLVSYTEHPFTAKAIPKIYFHMEFVLQAN